MISLNNQKAIAEQAKLISQRDVMILPMTSLKNYLYVNKNIFLYPFVLDGSDRTLAK